MNQAKKSNRQHRTQRLSFAKISGAILMCLHVIAVSNLLARPLAAQPVFTPALARGLSLAHWFSQSHNGLNPHHLSNFITATDMQRLVATGFTHVRLPVEMGPAFGIDETSQRIQVILLEKIKQLIDSGLGVVVDLHPTDTEKVLVQAFPHILPEGWARFARLLSGFPPTKLAVEVMNEPHPMKGLPWQELQASAAKAIRGVLPEHTIIANPGNWSGIDDFADFHPLPDRNVVYTAHIYEPTLFSHQGASWSWDIAKDVKALPWPVPPSEAETQARLSATQEKSLEILKNSIAKGMMERQWLQQYLDKLTHWQARSGGPTVWIGEFGIYRKYAPREARLVWHRELRSSFNARGWGWALWEYVGDFGILQPGADRPYDSELLETLGLHR